MAEIDNQLVINFENEYLRPLCEDMRSLKANLDDAATVYTAEVSGPLAGFDNADTITRDGVPVVTKADMSTIISILSTLITQFDTGSTMDNIIKHSVRPLRVR